MRANLSLTAVLCGSLLFSPVLYAKTSKAATPVEMLQQMEKATTSLNYELAYINISKRGIESLRYRHALVDHQTYAQLLQMDGPKREVIQRDHSISYFDATSGVEPFTLPGSRIIDGLPSIIFANFDGLDRYYDFIKVGRSRIADQMCDVIRVVSRDGSRYSYVLWLDVETYLPMRIDLLTQDGEPIEQFQVVSFAVDDGVQRLMSGLKTAKLPPVLNSLPKGDQQKLNWQPGWLPAGVKLVSQSRRDVPSVNKTIDSRLYSDGLFSFTVNVTQASGRNASQSYSTGRRTVFLETRHNKEISVVGEIPKATAKRIADSVKAGN